MVYVLDKDNNPLMSTKRHGKVRHLLNDNKAKVVKKNPFTIKLLYKSTTFKQKVTLGVDSGGKVIGVLATTKEKEVYASEVILRNDIVKLLATKRQK
ncbi:MAG: RRXRR domain-containing protein [Bacillota bacterium]|nr:RRXRR domain-containing protein [Bacillota bacterium]